MSAELTDTLRALLASQSLGVLATQREGRPHGSLVAFTPAEDLRTVLFATARATRKFENIVASPPVALLVDNRNNRESDFHEAAAVTIYGAAEEVPDGERPTLEALHLARHPYLTDFLRASSCALVRIRVERYSLVTRFQNVNELEVGAWDWS